MNTIRLAIFAMDASWSARDWETTFGNLRTWQLESLEVANTEHGFIEGVAPIPVQGVLVANATDVDLNKVIAGAKKFMEGVDCKCALRHAVHTRFFGDHPDDKVY